MTRKAYPITVPMQTVQALMEGICWSRVTRLNSNQRPADPLNASQPNFLHMKFLILERIFAFPQSNDGLLNLYRKVQQTPI